MQKTLIVVLFFLCAVSCNNQENNRDTPAGEHKVIASPPKSKLDSAGTKKLMALITDYYALKDAFIATNAVNADQAANKLKSSADSMKTYMQKDSVKDSGISMLLDTLSMNSEKIIAEKDETTEKKRIHFEKVSDAMFSLLKQAELKNAGVYRQYCPMAFNDKGAYWLSNEAEIKNPYFGKKMLECGEVADSLK